MRWLLWCFYLLAESYETINHYHYHYYYIGISEFDHSLVVTIAVTCDLRASSAGDDFIYMWRHLQVVTEIGIVSINLPKAENDDMDALHVRSIKNFEILTRDHCLCSCLRCKSAINILIAG